MSVTKPRNRLVYFRLSEDEFQKLSRMCNGAEGARSISEVARSAVNRVLAEHNREVSLFDGKLEELRAQIGTLTELLATNQLLVRPGSGAAAPGNFAEDKGTDNEDR